jgi:hypothetical protein
MKTLKVATIFGLVLILHFLILKNYLPPSTIFLIIPLIIITLLKYPVVFSCQVCGIEPDDEGFYDPDRELQIKFDYAKIGNDGYSKFYKIYLRMRNTKSGACAACTKRIREQTRSK